jgi:eukaryotic-like serine/threonine-protein kinase
VLVSVDTERPLEPGTVVARNYRVTQRLGAGGMGTVYLAENLTLNQRVVVKVLRGEGAGTGHEEAQMLAQLQHPNVVTVYAHDPALDCIIMEFLDGASLATLLEKGIDRVNSIRIALAVAEALAAVHKRGLVHRDFKPENVMLALNQGGGGRFVDWLKLIDFGTALKSGKVPPVLLGTPEFCGPEQFHPEPALPANDVYALGVTIFLMMTGVFPFDGPREDLPRAQHEDPPPQLIDTLVGRFGKGAFDPRTLALLEDLGELLQQMLAKVPSERPTAHEVARRLTRLESSFAEAGTYVGTKTSNAALQEVATAPPKKRTSVLAREKRPIRHPTTERTVRDGSTAPHLQPIDTPTREVKSPPKTGPSMGLIAVLGLVVLGLGGALLAIGNSEERVDVVPDAGLAQTSLPPVPVVEEVDAGTTAEVPVDAGVEDEVAALPVDVKLKPKATPRPPPLAPCKFDSKFASDARARFTALVTKLPPAERDAVEEKGGDDLAEALRLKDCRKTELVLKALSGRVRGSQK